jgi:hypothetical protein
VRYLVGDTFPIKVKSLRRITSNHVIPFQHNEHVGMTFGKWTPPLPPEPTYVAMNGGGLSGGFDFMDTAMKVLYAFNRFKRSKASTVWTGKRN